MNDELRADSVVGRIKTIFRFPIKSVGGRSITDTYVDMHGSLGDHRYAFIDVETGNVIEFVDDELEMLQKRIAEKLGFRLVDHRMELYGVALDRSR